MTTCAYCGVGCSFKAEIKGNQVVRMVPNKDGHANHGHSCVKGRFAFGYTTHSERILKPMLRKSIDDPWKEVSWNEAIQYVASEFNRIQGTRTVRIFEVNGLACCIQRKTKLGLRVINKTPGGNAGPAGNDKPVRARVIRHHAPADVYGLVCVIV